MTSKGWATEKLAAEMGCSHSTAVNLLSHETKRPVKYEQYLKALEVLGYDIQVELKQRAS